MNNVASSGRWIITYEQLSEWKELLEKEPHIEGDGITTVIGQIEDILHQIQQEMKREVDNTPLTETDMAIGEKYVVADGPDIAEEFKGVLVTVIEKKESGAVRVLLLEDIEGYKKGDILHAYPHQLRRFK